MFIQIEDPDEIASEIDEIAGKFSILLEQEIATDTALIKVGHLGISNLNKCWQQKLTIIYERQIPIINFKYKEIKLSPNQAIFEMLYPYTDKDLRGMNFPSKAEKNRYSKKKLLEMVENFLNKVSKILGKPSKVWHRIKRKSEKEHNFFRDYYRMELDELFLEFPNYILMLEVGI